MGLGKTVQSVSMLGFLQVELNNSLFSFIMSISDRLILRTNVLLFDRMLNKFTDHFLSLYHCPPCQTGPKNLGSGCLI